MKKSLVYVGESPFCVSGWGKVSYYLIPALEREFDVIPIYLNHPDYVYSGLRRALVLRRDERMIESFKRFLREVSPDIIFMAIDITTYQLLFEVVLSEPVNSYLMCYLLVDSPFYDDYFSPLLNFDLVIFATNFGRTVFNSFVNKNNIKVIFREAVVYFGVDFSKFYPLSQDLNQWEESRKKSREIIFSRLDPFLVERKMILNISRNQVRKNLPGTLYVYRLLYERWKSERSDPPPFLYLHCNYDEEKYWGYNLARIVKYLNLPENCVIFPSPSFIRKGAYNEEFLNLVYNSADVFLSTSYGEGFGLFILESMATLTPLVVPDNTVFRELVGEDRGFLFKVRNELIFPLLRFSFPHYPEDPLDAMRVLYEVLTGKVDFKKKLSNGLEFALKNQWDSCTDKVLSLIKECSSEKKVGRFV